MMIRTSQEEGLVLAEVIVLAGSKMRPGNHRSPGHFTVRLRLWRAAPQKQRTIPARQVKIN